MVGGEHKELYEIPGSQRRARPLMATVRSHALRWFRPHLVDL